MYVMYKCILKNYSCAVKFVTRYNSKSEVFLTLNKCTFYRSDIANALQVAPTLGHLLNWQVTLITSCYTNT